MTTDDADLGTLLQRCVLPATAGMDAMEARLITVQDVPPKTELRFFAVRGESRERLSSSDARGALRRHVPEKPISALTETELLIEVDLLRTEVSRLRPVYAAAKELRAVHDADERVSNCEVQQRCDCALCTAVDAVIAAEDR